MEVGDCGMEKDPCQVVWQVNETRVGKGKRLIT